MSFETAHKFKVLLPSEISQELVKKIIDYHQLDEAEEETEEMKNYFIYELDSCSDEYEKFKAIFSDKIRQTKISTFEKSYEEYEPQLRQALLNKKFESNSWEVANSEGEFELFQSRTYQFPNGYIDVHSQTRNIEFVVCQYVDGDDCIMNGGGQHLGRELYAFHTKHAIGAEILKKIESISSEKFLFTEEHISETLDKANEILNEEEFELYKSYFSTFKVAETIIGAYI